MANYSRWGDTKNKRRALCAEKRGVVEHDLALGRHLVVSFPETVPAEVVDAVQVA